MNAVLKGVVLSMLLSTGSLCLAGEEMLELDSRMRAKLSKEKIKHSAQERAMGRLDKGFDRGLDNADCGSQNIGNIDTSGRPGMAPREVFVFAPNAINVVPTRGCR